MTPATLYLNGSPVAEVTEFTFTAFDETIARANAAITETIANENITAEPGSTMGAMVALDEHRAFTAGVVAAAIETTFITDVAFESWLSGFANARPRTRAELRLSNKARRSIRRQLVRLAGSHDRWSRGVPRSSGGQRFLCGASVPRSLR